MKFALTRRTRTGAIRLGAAIALVAAVAPAFNAAALAAGTNYYVSPSGSDANAGTSATAPYQHIQKCADTAQPGDTCLISSGSYRETVTLRTSGTSAAPISFQPVPGATVSVDGTEPVAGWSKVTTIPATVNGSPDPFLAGGAATPVAPASPTPFATAVASGAVYQAHVVMNLNSSLPNATTPDPQVFLNGKMTLLAQWPPAPANEDPLTPTVVSAQDGSNNTTITNAGLNQPAGYWNGASVYVNGTYDPQVLTVTNSSPGTLTVCCLDTASLAQYPPPAANVGTSPGGGFNLCGHIDSAMSTRFYLFNKLESLSNPGDWFYDTSAQTLYFRAPAGVDLTAAANAGAVSVKQRNLAFDLATNTVSNVHLTGLNIFGATVATGITPTAASTGDILDSLNVDYPSHYTYPYRDPNEIQSTGCDILSSGGTTTGVMLAGHGNTIRNSTVAHSAGSGILLRSDDSSHLCIAGHGTNGAIRGCGNPEPSYAGNTATNNVIHDVDYASTYDTAGVTLIGDNNTVTYNTIRRTGRSGIMVNSDIAGTEMYNTRIAYNDLSGYGMLNLDVGGMYFIAKINFAPDDSLTGTNGTLHPNGSRIDHNWVHDPLPMPGIYDPSTEGIYPDGGDANLQVDNNVGWNNTLGTISVSADGNEKNAYGLLFFNNTGGTYQLANDVAPKDAPATSTWNDPAGWIWIPHACYPGTTTVDCSRFANNIGNITMPLDNATNGVTDPNLVMDHNLPSACTPITNCDPGFVDTRVNNFQLSSTSTARQAGAVVPGVTAGSTDVTPSLGAYQYGAPPWIPGNGVQTNTHVSRYGPTSFTADPDWNSAKDALGLRDDPWLFKNAFLAPFGAAVNGDLRYAYPTPATSPTAPAFNGYSNLEIDKVEVHFFARNRKHTAASTVVLSGPTGTLWSAPMTLSGNNNFENRYSPIVIDLTQQVAGNWANLPAWLNIHASMDVDAYQGWFLDASGVLVTGLEIVVTSHPFGTTPV